MRIPINKPLDGRRNAWAEPRPFSELPSDIQSMLVKRQGGAGRRSALEVLEGKHVMELLLYIDGTQPVLKSDIYNNVSRSEGMVRKISDLRDLGLIEIYSTARYNSNVIVLTGKGKSTVEAIRNLVSIAQEGLEP